MNDATRFLAWAATLQDFGAAALVSSLVCLLGAQTLPSEHLHLEDRLPVAAVSRDLGIVGIPTITDIRHAQTVSGSAAILPSGR